MNDKDLFAVWMADTMLRANRDEFAADALAELARQAKSSEDLDRALTEATSNETRPGDMGLEIVGPFLPVLLVEFGRMLWDAYLEALAEKGGEALATATVTRIKALVRQTWAGSEPAVPLSTVEQSLRGAATRLGLNQRQADGLIASLHKPETARAIEND